MFNINFIQRKRHNLPKIVKNVWYNRSNNMSDEKHPIIFDENGEYIPCKVGLIVSFKDLSNGKVAYYKVIKMWTERPWSDWLHPSDAVNCDLKFSHIK